MPLLGVTVAAGAATFAASYFGLADLLDRRKVKKTLVHAKVAAKDPYASRAC
jgi:hypothetical protein